MDFELLGSEISVEFNSGSIDPWNFYNELIKGRKECAKLIDCWYTDYIQKEGAELSKVKGSNEKLKIDIPETNGFLLDEKVDIEFLFNDWLTFKEIVYCIKTKDLQQISKILSGDLKSELEGYLEIHNGRFEQSDMKPRNKELNIENLKDSHDFFLLWQNESLFIGALNYFVTLDFNEKHGLIESSEYVLSNFITKFKWNGNGKKLAELFIMLGEKGYIKDITQSDANSILALFDVDVTEGTFKQYLKPGQNKRSSFKNTRETIFGPEYHYSFQDIKSVK